MTLQETYPIGSKVKILGKPRSFGIVGSNSDMDKLWGTGFVARVIGYSGDTLKLEIPGVGATWTSAYYEKGWVERVVPPTLHNPPPQVLKVKPKKINLKKERPAQTEVGLPTVIGSTFALLFGLAGAKKIAKGLSKPAEKTVEATVPQSKGVR